MEHEVITEIHDLPSGIRRMLFQQTGSQNRRQGKPCEDVIFVKETSDLYFWGLADGQSGTRCGALGAEACLKALERFIREIGLNTLLDHPFPDELPCILMRTMRGSILSLCRSQSGDFHDYASTVLAMALDPVTGRYVLVHLGDGCAVSVRKDQSLVMLSASDNGPLPHHTWLTTSGNAVNHLRLRFGGISGNTRVILMTDGAKKLSNGKNIPRQAREKITHGTQMDLISYLSQSDPIDDTSCIVLDQKETHGKSHPDNAV